jgi:WD40 repeat protein
MNNYRIICPNCGRSTAVAADTAFPYIVKCITCCTQFCCAAAAVGPANPIPPPKVRQASAAHLESPAAPATGFPTRVRTRFAECLIVLALLGLALCLTLSVVLAFLQLIRRPATSAQEHSVAPRSTNVPISATETFEPLSVAEPAIPTSVSQPEQRPANSNSSAWPITFHDTVPERAVKRPASLTRIAIPERPPLLRLTYEKREAGNIAAIVRCEGEAAKKKETFGQFAVSPDARVLAVAVGDGSVSVWELVEGRELRRATSCGAPLALSADGRWLVATVMELERSRRFSPIPAVKILDLAKDDGGSTLTAPTGPLTRIVVSGKGERIVTAGREQVAVMDPSNSQVFELRGPEKSAVKAIAISPNGSHVAAGFGTGLTMVWPVSDLSNPSEKMVSTKEIQGLWFSPRATNLVVLSDRESSGGEMGGEWSVLQIPGLTTQPCAGLQTSRGLVGIGFRADDHFCVSTGNYSTGDYLRVARISAGTVEQSAILPSGIHHRQAVWAPQASKVVCRAGQDGYGDLHVIDLNSGWFTQAPPPFATYKHPVPVRGVMFSASGKFITAGQTVEMRGNNSHCEVSLANWDLPTGGDHTKPSRPAIRGKGSWQKWMHLYQGPGNDDVSLELVGSSDDPSGLIVWNINQAMPRLVNRKQTRSTKESSSNLAISFAANCSAGVFAELINHQTKRKVLHQIQAGTVARAVSDIEITRGDSHSTTLSPDGTRALTHSSDGWTIVDFRNGSASIVPSALGEKAYWSADSMRFYTVNENKLATYDATTFKKLANLELPTEISDLVESAAHGAVFVSGTDRQSMQPVGVIVALKPIDLSLIGGIEAHYVTSDLAEYIPKSSRIHPRSLNEASISAGLKHGMTTSLAISPDSEMLAAGGATGEAKVWRIPSLMERMQGSLRPEPTTTLTTVPFHEAAVPHSPALMHAAEPVDALYQGKPLSYWADQLNRKTGGSLAVHAAASFGAPAVPHLMANRKGPFATELQKALMQIGPAGASAIPELIRQLPDPWAAEVLGKIGVDSDQVAEALFRVVMQNQVPREPMSVRRVYTQALADIGRPGASRLSQLIKASPNAAIRADACAAAGSLQSFADEIRPAVVSRLNDERSVQKAAIVALDKLGSIANYADALAQIAVRDNKSDAWEVLRKHASEGATAVPVLEQALQDKNPETVRNAARLLDSIAPFRAAKQTP